jgi:hypothetical protein
MERWGDLLLPFMASFDHRKPERAFKGVVQCRRLSL